MPRLAATVKFALAWLAPKVLGIISYVHSSVRQFKTSAPHVLQKCGINAATFYFIIFTLLAEDVDFFLREVQAFIFLG